MKIEETKKIIDKIRIHRQTFGGHLDKNGLSNLTIEWQRIFEPYDFEDVDEKLNVFLRDGENFGRYPDAYYLVKYLKTSKEKMQKGEMSVYCNRCKMFVPYVTFDEHFDRCNSVEYLCRTARKYFGREFDREKMFAMSKEEFDSKYYEYCEKLLPKLDNEQLKHNLINVLAVKEGLPIKLDLAEILKIDERKFL